MGIRTRKYQDGEVQLMLRSFSKASSAKLRQELLQLLTAWLTQWQSPSLKQKSRQSVPSLKNWLQGFGTNMFATNLAKQELAKALSAVVQIFPWLRGSLAGSCKVVTMWKQREAPELRPPLPLRMLKACMMNVLHWHGPQMALPLLLGWYALLRPSGLFFTRELCMLPAKHDEGSSIFIEFTSLKSRRRKALHQYVRVDEPLIVQLLTKQFNSLKAFTQIWPSSPSMFWNRIDALLSALQRPAKMWFPSNLMVRSGTLVPNGTHWAKNRELVMALNAHFDGSEIWSADHFGRPFSAMKEEAGQRKSSTICRLRWHWFAQPTRPASQRGEWLRHLRITRCPVHENCVELQV